MFSSVVHLMLSHSISYPYLIEFHDFLQNIQQAMKHQMAVATQAQQGDDFQDNFNIYFLFFTIRTGPFPTCENLEPVRFSNWMPGESLGGFH
jgi:hypothetical protein